MIKALQDVVLNMRHPCMNDTPETYTIAIRTYRPGTYCTLGLWIIAIASCLFITAALSGRFTTSIALSAWTLVVTAGVFLTQPQAVRHCSRCDCEVASDPPVCHKCRCKCLAQEASPSAKPSWTWLHFVAFGTVIAAMMVGVRVYLWRV